MLKGKFFHLRFIIFIGILCKITIFLPCLAYGYFFFGDQIISENLKGNQMIADIMGVQILTNIGSIPAASVDVGFQLVELINKSDSKFGSGFIKFGDIVNTESVFISDPPSNECANNGKATSNEYKFVGTKIQFWLCLLIGGFLGSTGTCVMPNTVNRNQCGQ